MDNIIPIQKNIYSSNKFREVIDTRFSELFNTQDNFDVNDFFNQYNKKLWLNNLYLNSLRK